MSLVNNMITVKPRVSDKLIGIEIDGEWHMAAFTIDFAAAYTSWLLVMRIEYKGEEWLSPEYSDSPMLDSDMINLMCAGIERHINNG